MFRFFFKNNYQYKSQVLPPPKLMLLLSIAQRAHSFDASVTMSHLRFRVAGMVGKFRILFGAVVVR